MDLVVHPRCCKVPLNPSWPMYSVGMRLASFLHAALMRTGPPHLGNSASPCLVLLGFPIPSHADVPRRIPADQIYQRGSATKMGRVYRPARRPSGEFHSSSVVESILDCLQTVGELAKCSATAAREWKPNEYSNAESADETSVLRLLRTLASMDIFREIE